MLCEASCGLSVEVDGDTIKSIRGDKDDPFSRGYICPKATAIPDVMNDPDRIRAPQRRIGSRWETISWDEALDEAAARIAAVQRQHGRHAVALYLGNPTVHSHGAMLALPVFSKVLGSRARFSATSTDQLPQMLIALQMYGHQLLVPIPDVDRTAYMLILGANPLASNGSLMTAPGIGKRLEALKARGGRLVVVDPRRSETAELADEHVFIRPGGDAALLLGMLHVIVAEKLVALGKLSAFVDGLDALGGIVARFAPARVADRAGVPAATIERLARDFARAPSAICYGRVGASTQDFGGLASWAINALNLVTGNLDREGGVMFTLPAADVVGATGKLGDRGHFGVWKSRVRGLPEFGGELPTAALAEEIDTPGEGQIRALVTYAGNPVLSAPNGPRLDRALAGLDTMIAFDLYRNETTRHANLILPTSFGFERDHYDLIFYALSVRNVARFAPGFITPPSGVREDFDVVLELAQRLRSHGGGKPGLKWSLTLAAMRGLGPRRMLDAMLRLGPHRLSIKQLLRSPEGLDLGPLQPQLPQRLFTKGRRIQLVPQLCIDDLPRLEAALAEPQGGLVLIGRRALRSNNSWMHNAHRLVKGPEACTLLMHPDDATARGLLAGDRVHATTRVGTVAAPLEISDEVAPGVVSLPHGWGHDREGAELRVARAHAGVSINDLTDDQRLDTLSGNAAFSGVPIEVVRA